MMTTLADPMVTVPWTIRNVSWETDDTFTLMLNPVCSNGSGFHFKPGQFNMLYVFGVGEVPISISSNPKDPEAIEHTTRKVGVVTQAMGALQSGDTIGVRGPFGSHWPCEEALDKDVVIIAGGIGLAPLRPVLYELASRRGQYRRVVLLYGARTPADILFQKDFKKWGSKNAIEVYLTVDRGTRDWNGNVGVVTRFIRGAPFDPRTALTMICGPEIMMRYSILELQRRGVPDDRIYCSMERNMKCAIGHCGHCQYGPMFICKDGPVFAYHRIETLFGVREL